jgi:hypothetical protein
MTAPSQYLRDLREQRESRRLGVAKTLRDTPTATNIELARVFGVTRDTIAADRQAIMEQLKQSTLTETEQLRVSMLQRLQHLLDEIELHRKDKKLPVSLIHEMHLVTRSMIELLGVRKPVTEKLEVRKSTVSFATSIVSTVDGKASEPKTFAVVREQLALGEGSDEQP